MAGFTSKNMNETLINDLKAMEGGKVIVPVNSEIQEAFQWMAFKENNLNLTLNALQEDRYGFYDKELVMKVYSDLEDIRVDRQELISKVGEALLGDGWRTVLDDLGCEFQIDEAFPLVVFFRP